MSKNKIPSVRYTYLYVIISFSIISCQSDKGDNIESIYNALLINPDTIFHQQELNHYLIDEKTRPHLGWTATENLIIQKDALDNHLKNILDYNVSKTELSYIDSFDTNYNFENLLSGRVEDFQKFVLSSSSEFTQTSELEFNWLKRSLIDSKLESSKDIFWYVNKVLLTNKIYYTRNQIEQSISVLLQGIITINNLDPKGKFHRTRDKLTSELIILISKENNVLLYRDMLVYLYSSLSTEYKNSFSGIMLQSFIAEENLNIKEVDEKHITIEKVISHAETPMQLMMGYWSLGLLQEINKNKLYLSSYEKALSQFKDTCEINYFNILLYILSSNLSEAERNKYYAKYQKYNTCSKKVKITMDFLGPNYLNLSDFSAESDKEIDFLLEGRAKADVLFPGKSTLHLQDYFANNYNSIFTSINNSDYRKDNHIEDLINTCLDTRLRNVFRQRISEEERDPEKILRINHLLKELDEIHTYKTGKEEEYKELSTLYLTQELDDLKYSYKKLSIDDLSKRLRNNKHQLVNVYKGIENYLFYTFDGETFNQNNISVEQIDSLALSTSYDLEHSKYSKNVIYASLNKLNLDKEKPIIFIPDGAFSILPNHLLFPDHRDVYIYPDVYKYLESDSIFIKSSEVDIYSYSTTKSLENKKKLEYPELPDGLEEARDIHAMLDGSNLMSNSLLLMDNKKSSKLLHLSTHAYSSSSNRMDNFILTRKNNKVEKLYSFELYNKNNLPTVVVMSACDSGTGLHAYGAGVQTLSRAFLDNNTQTVIKTLWRVNEKATAEFMTTMYTHWKTGISLYEAIHKTQNDFKNHELYAHPYYWSAFVLEGSPDVYLKQ